MSLDDLRSLGPFEECGSQEPFAKVALKAAFKRAATPEQWSQLTRLPAPETYNEYLFLDSSPEGSQGHEDARRMTPYITLWGEVAEGVRPKLLAGEWLAYAYSHSHGPSLQEIPSDLCSHPNV